MLVKLSPFIAGIAALFLSACASQTLNTGASLAKAGQAAAVQMEDSVTLSDSTLSTFEDALAFNDAFNNATGNGDSKTVLKNLRTIQGGLRQYGNFLDHLASSYASLGDLAGYDAGGTFKNDIESLQTAGQSFASAVGSSFSIPNTASDPIKTVGAVIISDEQAKDVKERSKAIEGNLKAVIAILSDNRVKAKLVPVGAEVTGQIAQAALVLQTSNIYALSSITDEFGSQFGLKSKPDAEDIISRNSRIQAALNAVVARRLNEQINAMSDAYDNGLKALQALIPLHENLQKGEPLDLTTIKSYLDQLQTMMKSAQPPKGK